MAFAIGELMSTAAITHVTPDFDTARQRAIVRRAIAKGSFATLATASAANRPHVVAILYQAVDDVLYMNALDSSIKIRNVRKNPRVAVCIPTRRLPFGPPFVVQFQGTADLLAPDDPQIVELARAGSLKRITSHGELEMPGLQFIRITPARRVSSFGLGVPLLDYVKDPLASSRTVDLS
jgi:general stress protein 26